MAFGVLAWASEMNSVAQAQVPPPDSLLDSFADDAGVDPTEDNGHDGTRPTDPETSQEGTDLEPPTINAEFAPAPDPLGTSALEPASDVMGNAVSDRDPWDADPGNWAGTPASDSADSAAKTTSAFDATLRVLLTGGGVQPAETPLNPANDVLMIPRASADLELRPELTGNIGDWTLNARPRAALSWRHSALEAEDEFQSDAFLLEWSARWQVATPLYLVAGKQNLQWGPSLVASPSNEILLHNKHLNPVVETPGTYLGRVVWIMSPTWSASAIANLLKGEKQELYKPFERRYALKADYSGESLQVTMLAGLGEDSGPEAGGYLLWVAADELFLYIDWRAAMRSRARRPVRNRDADLGLAMGDTGGRWDPAASVLAGASYTFANNITAVVEYLLQTDGYTDSESDLLWTLQRRAAEAFLGSDAKSAAVGAELASAYDYQLRYLRRHYLIPQFRYQWENNQGTCSALWMVNVDDWTSSVILSLEYGVSSHVTIGGFAMLNTGIRRGELSRVIDGVGTLTLSYTF